jgi:hypothetical protein
MKKIFFPFCLAICVAQGAFSQGGTWTWISGTTAPNASGSYGTQGIPSVTNHPPADYEYMEWKDKQGSFWIYGGSYAYYADLWKFNPSTLEWTWMQGNGAPWQPAVYGVQGIPSPTNTPGTCGLGAATWVDTSGNFWLFGGMGSAGFLNDLWKYDVTLNQWAWMKGSQTGSAPGIHGVMGIPSTLNTPGARTENACSWADTLNNLWLFGGLGYDDVGGYGNLNDLCKFDIATNEWTWMKGSNLASAFTVYGTKGVSDPANDPGSRFCYSKWKDPQDNMWVFAGYGNDSFDDVWKYNPSVNEWTWMSGNSFLNYSGNYLPYCIEDTAAIPAARRENRSSIPDNCGRFWLFGGFRSGSGMLNDTWIFNPTDLKWKLLHGYNTANAPGNSGTMGVPSPSNIPESRCGSVSWWGDDNKFYMFGGAVNSFVNIIGDMWVFDPDTSCVTSCQNTALPVALFTAPNTICPGTCTDFINNSSNALSYQWFFAGANPSVSTDVNPTSICYNTPGNYDVTLVATNATGNDTLMLANFITVFPFPSPQGIMLSGDTLFANPGATSYQWYYNGNLISGATDYYYVASQSGDYNVVATDENSCEVEAVINDVLAAVTNTSLQSVQIYPNPVQDKLYVSTMLNGSAKVSIYNLLGETVLDLPLPESKLIEVSSLESGLYYLQITQDEKIFRTKFVKK